MPKAARKELEELMATGTYEYKSDFARTYLAEGEARSVLAVLEARGFAVPEGIRERITGCADPEQLDVWVRRAATVERVDDLFA